MTIIKFPVTDIDRRGLFAIHGFPSVIGCIDDTHVKLQSPRQADEAAYVYRKHQHIINVQATCDHKDKILE